jgi:hypothetical protein
MYVPWESTCRAPSFDTSVPRWPRALSVHASHRYMATSRPQAHGLEHVNIRLPMFIEVALQGTTHAEHHSRACRASSDLCVAALATTAGTLVGFARVARVRLTAGRQAGRDIRNPTQPRTSNVLGRFIARDSQHRQPYVIANAQRRTHQWVA